MSIEVVAVPILMKAVDFLFGEAKKILEERRAARQKDKQSVAAPPDIPLLNESKEIVVRRKVSEELVKRQEQALQGLLDEIAIYQQNLQRLQKRVALEGGMDFAPVSVVNQLRAQQDAILDKSQQLAAIVDSLSK
jgi:transposase